MFQKRMNMLDWAGKGRACRAVAFTSARVRKSSRV